MTNTRPLKQLTLLAALIGSSVFTRSASSQTEKPKSLSGAPLMAAIEKTCKTYSGYDRDGDGHNEIEFVRPATIGKTSLKSLGKGGGTVLVLVEDRLWNGTTPDIRPSVKTYIEDLAREGYSTIALDMSIYSGPIHQDGLTTLAIRDLLKAVYKSAPNLKSAVFVGNFPSAFLVRQFYWQRRDGMTLHAGTKVEQTWNAVPHVRSVAEPVAKPFDLVLADLDGNWDQLYRKGPERLSGLLAAFPDDPNRELSSQFQYTAEQFEDFFLVQDGNWEEHRAAEGKRRFVFKGEANNEVTAGDRQQTNIVARPEISIGRINAYRAAVIPDPAIKGVHGEGLLDENGHPQPVEFADDKSVPQITKAWIPSEALERKLLIEYFDRNHRYRTGGYAKDALAYRPANISTEWGSSVPEMRQSIPGWGTSDSPAAQDDAMSQNMTGDKITITDFVRWMKQPALARAIKAHSNGLCSQFSRAPDVAALEREAGSQIWYWTRVKNRLIPSLKGLGGQYNFGLLRTLYENHTLPNTPNLFFHTGCESLMPVGYEDQPYNSPDYGRWQVSESLLMFGNGLALVGRGKVFYDEPREFWKVLGQGGTWGDAWKRYFDVEGGDARLAKVGIDRKHAYFWSLIGDPTLTLPSELLTSSSKSGVKTSRR